MSVKHDWQDGEKVTAADLNEIAEAINEKVTGTNDGTNWTSLTIDGTEMAIPNRDELTAGDGIDITDNEISAVVKSGDKYIEVTADGIASKGIDEAIAAEATIARAAEGALDDKIDGVADDLAAEVTRATGVEGGLNTRLTAAEGEIDALQTDVTTIKAKPAYDITDTQISNWDNEVGAKAAVTAEETRAKAAEQANAAAITAEAARADAVIEAAIEALDVTDTAVEGKYVSAVNEVDGKIVVTRESLPEVDIPEYTIVKQATAESEMASTYYLTKDGTQVGAKINIPKDQFLKEAKFFATKAAAEGDGKTVPAGTEFPALYFLFEQTAGESETWIPVKSLVDVYTAGDGIDIANNVISVDNTIALKSEIPTATSDLTNDSRFITDSYHDSTKQEKLVSGTNIKTINGTSLLGSGNITIGSTFALHVSTEAGDTPAGIKWTKEIQEFPWQIEITGTLVASGDTKGYIFLVPINQGQASNIYAEYITVELASSTLDNTTYSWEKIGTTEANLENYYTKTEVDNLVDEKQDNLPINANGHYAYNSERGEIYVDTTSYATTTAVGDVVDDIAALETGMTSLTSRVGSVEDGLEDTAEAVVAEAQTARAAELALNQKWDTQADAIAELSTGKQNTLTAGTNIAIVNDVISATSAIESVNGQTGTVVLDASDINTEDDITIDEAIGGIKTDIAGLDTGKQDKITSSNKLSYNLLSNTPTIPTATSDLTNDSGFITSSYHDSTKQDVLTAGQNISIVDNVISATGGGSYTSYTDIEHGGKISDDILGNNRLEVDTDGIRLYTDASVELITDSGYVNLYEMTEFGDGDKEGQVWTVTKRSESDTTYTAGWRPVQNTLTSYTDIQDGGRMFGDNGSSKIEIDPHGINITSDTGIAIHTDNGDIDLYEMTDCAGQEGKVWTVVKENNDWTAKWMDVLPEKLQYLVNNLTQEKIELLVNFINGLAEAEE